MCLGASSMQGSICKVNQRVTETTAVVSKGEISLNYACWRPEDHLLFYVDLLSNIFPVYHFLFILILHLLSLIKIIVDLLHKPSLLHLLQQVKSNSHLLLPPHCTSLPFILYPSTFPQNTYHYLHLSLHPPSSTHK